MAKRNKAKTKKRGAAKTSEAPAPAPTSLNDDQLQALAIKHRDAFKVSKKAKADAGTAHKKVCDLAKSELGKDAVKMIEIMIECDSPEGEKAVVSRLKNTMAAARWAGVDVGTQFTMFNDAEAGGSRSYEEGKRAGMAGEPCKAPANASGDDEQDYLKGWHVGNDARNKNLADAVGAGDAATANGEDADDGEGQRVPRSEWQRNLRKQNEEAERGIAEAAKDFDRKRGIGTAEPTHQVVS
jgi:hypothetical protein